jgi:hypothetical protein
VYLNFSASVILEKRTFKDFSKINTCKHGSPFSTPSRPLENVIIINLISLSVRKIPCKFQLFWPSGSSKKILKVLSYINTLEFFSLSWPQLTDEDHAFNKRNSALFQEVSV